MTNPDPLAEIPETLLPTGETLRERARKACEHYGLDIKSVSNRTGELGGRNWWMVIGWNGQLSVFQDGSGSGMVMEKFGLRDPIPSPAGLDAAEAETIAYADKYRDKWADKDDNYWLQRLMQEVGELASVLAGDHDDTVEHELRQVGSIAINWLRRRYALTDTEDNGR